MPIGYGSPGAVLNYIVLLHRSDKRSRPLLSKLFARKLWEAGVRVLQEGRENANIDTVLGFIWRISVKEETADERYQNRVARIHCCRYGGDEREASR